MVLAGASDGGADDILARILVIDDEVEIRSLLRALLERAGYEVLDAEDGNAAGEVCRNGSVDLIITDLLMPVQDGLEVIVEMKRECPDIKVIAVSGGGRSAQLNLLPAARQLGAARTFEKPFSTRALLDAITELLAGDAKA